MKRIWDSRSDREQSYCAPVVSNGSLCTLLDYHGDQPQTVRYTYHGEKGSPVQMTPGIFRAGRRWDTPNRQLIPFGHFEEVIRGNRPEPLHAVQTLALDSGSVTSSNSYKGNLCLKTAAFVHKERSLFAVRKEFSRSVPYEFSYFYTEPGPECKSVKWTDFSILQTSPRSAEIRYEQLGTALYRGIITVMSSCDAEITLEKNRIRFRFDPVPGTADFFMLYSDNRDGNDFEAETEELRRAVEEKGFEGLLAEQNRAWGEFWNTFSVELPDKHLQDVFYTALYNLECFSTRWAVPVGIHPYSWNGNYFSFNLFGPLFFATGHRKEASRISAFRRATLDAAKMRVTNWSYSAGARYPWMMDEEGLSENASPGVWLDHIFHMGNIATEMWEAFLYTRDMTYLKETAYPVLLGCAEFYEKQAVYHTEDGRTIIGKFCDLERLGTARENVFLTTCSAITTFDKAAQTAELLGVDAARSAVWRHLAGELKEGLASDGGKYIPFPGCPELSIGMMGGVYPYRALPADDPKQLAAISHFAENCCEGGNMYPVGKNICTWYASWISTALSRIGERELAADFIRRAAGTTGAFDVIYEINEPGAFVSHPWCSAPPASYLDGILELLLSESEGTLTVAEKLPELWKNFAFTLFAHDDLRVSCRCEKGKFTKLEISAGPDHSGTVKEVLAAGKRSPLRLAPGQTISLC